MKHYRVEIMPTARTGLLETGEYIALDNPVRAMSFRTAENRPGSGEEYQNGTGSG